jgi:hypothetical protein
MIHSTDPAARLVFDLGANTSGVNISNIKVDEVTSTVTSAGMAVRENPITLYPNPATSYVTIQSDRPYDRVELFDLRGRSVATFETMDFRTLDLTQIPKGIYVLLLTRGRENLKARLVKK